MKFLRRFYKRHVHSCFDYMRLPICLSYRGALAFLGILITEFARIPYNFKAICHIVREKTWEFSDNFEEKFSFFSAYIQENIGQRKCLSLHILRSAFYKIVRNNFLLKLFEAATGDILKKSCSYKFYNVHRKRPVLKSNSHV